MESHFAWSDINDIPRDWDAPILAYTNNKKLIVFKNTKTYLGGDVEHPFSGFKHLVEKYNIKYWVYQDNVINI